MPDIPAKAVEIEKLSRARCKIPGCGWEGPPHLSYQEANADRLEHLDEHRAGRL